MAVSNSATASAAAMRLMRRSPPRDLQLSALLLLGFAVAAEGLHVLLDGQGWWVAVVVAVAVVLGSAAITRSLTDRSWLPPLVSAVVLVCLGTLFFAPASALLGIIPTLDTPAAWQNLLTSANASIYRQAIPANADAPILFVMCLGIGAIAIAADLLAITLRRPAIAGVPLLAVLAVPALTGTGLTDPLFFVLAAIVYLVILLGGSARRQPRLSAAIGSVAVVGALVLPLILPTIAEPLDSVTPGIATGVNPVLSLGDDLRQAAERTVLTYTTQSGAPHYLRLVTLENFTGQQFAPTPERLNRRNSVDSFSPAPGLSGEVATSYERTSIEVGDLASPWLPTTYPATRITGLSGDWYYGANGFAVSSPGQTSQGQQYSVQSLQLEPTPAQLLAAGTTVPTEFSPYLALPPDVPAIIPQTAEQVAGTAGTNYEKALALQQYFRSDAFTYSETAPVEGNYDGTGIDVVAKFLAVKSGYCVHFASAMAVMARSLGIPSRVVVGFLPGSSQLINGVSSYAVTTHDLHSWPELYFQNIGWVQFEPTPGRGQLSEYADVSAPGVPFPRAPVTETPGTTTAPSPTPSASSAAGVRPSDAPTNAVATGEQTALPFAALALLALALVSFIPAVIGAARERALRARIRSGTSSAVAAWRSVLRTAVDLRIPVARTETPRETAAGIAAQVGDSGGALDRLLLAVEREQFGRDGGTDAAALGDDHRAVIAALRRGSPRPTRLGARLYPRSLWRRIVRPFQPDEVEERTPAHSGR